MTYHATFYSFYHVEFNIIAGTPATIQINDNKSNQNPGKIRFVALIFSSVKNYFHLCHSSREYISFTINPVPYTNILLRVYKHAKGATGLMEGYEILWLNNKNGNVF